MNNSWINILLINPIETFLKANDSNLRYFVLRDLLDEKINKPVNYLKTPEIRRILSKQLPDGSWRFPGNASMEKFPSINYFLIETYKSLHILTGKYELTIEQPEIKKATDYIFTCQTKEGDIRGILGNQYMPYYCGAILELLIKAGLASDTRVSLAMEWLKSNRQNDGGWMIPLQAISEKRNKYDNNLYNSPSLAFDYSLASSHLATGMIIRAFSIHPDYKNDIVTKNAGEFLLSRLFKADKYTDRQDANFWIKFKYPFWWTDLICVLDSLYNIGFTIKNKQIEKAIEWFLVNQQNDGLWNTQFDKGNPEKVGENRTWVGYSICRMLKKYI
jgi:hypothetical protein